MTLFTLIFVSFCLCAFSLLYYHKLWNPILVFSFMIFVGAVFSIGDKDAYDLENAFFWLTIGELIFSVAFLSAQVLFNRRTTSDYTINIHYNWITVDHLLTFNVICAFLSLLVNTYSVMQVAPSFAEIFTNSTYVRFLYLERPNSPVINAIGIFISFNFFTTFCLYPLALQNNRKHANIKLIFSLILCLCSSLVTMSKEAFLIDIVIFVSAYVLTVRNSYEEARFYRTYAFPIAILIIILLVVISFQRNYIGQGTYNSYGNAVIGTIRSYVAAPVVAFCQLLGVSNIHFTNGQLCFRPILNILSYLGIGSRVSIIQEAIAGSANVYTVFGNMYRDFSYPGILLLSIVFGAFLGLIYNTNYKYRLSNIVANSIVMMTMFFGYYDLKIIQTVYLFVMLYAMLFDRVFKSRIYITE